VSLLNDTRLEIDKKIEENDMAGLLYLTGLMHGHHCVGSAMGVIAAHHAMKVMDIKESTGMEHVIAVVETNSCFSDGVQMVTGCSFGNNSLVYRDLGKTAFSLVRRDGKGIRITVKPDLGDLLKDNRPESLSFSKLVNERKATLEEEARIMELNKEHCYSVVEIPAEKIFDVEPVEIKLPSYSRMMESLICPICGEKFMETKAVRKGDDLLCGGCGGEYNQLDWSGIRFVKDEAKTSK
jgi:formylmethanofuran dehydrogenase subunit E